VEDFHVGRARLLTWRTGTARPPLHFLPEDRERIAVGQFRERETNFTRITQENLEAVLYRGQTLRSLQFLAFVFGHYTFPRTPEVQA
jgi:hypothetical protein